LNAQSLAEFRATEELFLFIKADQEKIRAAFQVIRDVVERMLGQIEGVIEQINSFATSGSSASEVRSLLASARQSRDGVDAVVAAAERISPSSAAQVRDAIERLQFAIEKLQFGSEDRT
jgi:hypothetical protein